MKTGYIACFIGILLVLSSLSYGFYIKGNEDMIKESNGFMTFYAEQPKISKCELERRANINRAKQFAYDEKDAEEERLRNKITRNWYARIDGEAYLGYDEEVYGKFKVIEV